MRSLSRLRPGAAVRVRMPFRFLGPTGVVVSVSADWVTVAVGWRERRTVPRRDVIEIVARVGPLRPGGEYVSARLSGLFDRAVWPDDDGPGGGGPDGDGEPYPTPYAA